MTTTTLPTPAARASLADVLAAVAAGAGSTAEVARRTGMTVEQAETALAALAATGRIRRALVFASGPCDTDGCGSCASARGCPPAGMGSLAGSGLTAWRVVAR